MKLVSINIRFRLNESGAWSGCSMNILMVNFCDQSHAQDHGHGHEKKTSKLWLFLFDRLAICLNNSSVAVALENPSVESTNFVS